MHYDIDIRQQDHPLTEDTAYVRQRFRSFKGYRAYSRRNIR